MEQVWRESTTSLPHRYPNEEKSFAIFSITILSVRYCQWEFQPLLPLLCYMMERSGRTRTRRKRVGENGRKRKG